MIATLSETHETFNSMIVPVKPSEMTVGVERAAESLIRDWEIDSPH